MITKHMFQFHNGTINTTNPENNDFIITMFQFHNGTINTRTDASVLCLM